MLLVVFQQECPCWHELRESFKLKFIAGTSTRKISQVNKEVEHHRGQEGFGMNHVLFSVLCSSPLLAHMIVAECIECHNVIEFALV